MRDPPACVRTANTFPAAAPGNSLRPMRVRILSLLASVAAAAALLRAKSRRHHRSVAERLRPGEDGILPGAGPIYLEGTGHGAVLLLHGFGDTPQSLARMARFLNEEGWTVSVPLLPGHGRSLEEFAESTGEAWLAAAREALEVLRETRHPVFLIGQSMGGALATILAAEYRDLPGLVLLAPYLGMPRALRWIARSHPVLGLLSPWMPSRGERSILDPEAREASLSYGTVATRLLAELLDVSERARAAAPRVQAPVLVMFSRQDHRIPREEAERGFAALGSREKWLTWLEEPGHVLSVDFGHERTFRLVSRWLVRRGAVRVPLRR